MLGAMESNIRLGRILGIPIGLHWSWFLIFGLLTWSLAAGYFPAEAPGLSGPAYWLLAVATSLLFFASVLLHELGHSVIALRNQVPVRSITLFVFGGVALIEREPPTAGAEFRIAIAGPLASLALAAGFGVLWLADQAIPYLAVPSFWLARVNFILAIFNMIPGFPLDGGRVLRAVMWRLTGSPERATRIAAMSGQLVAFGFIAWGIMSILGGNAYNGIWLALIGWFLQNAAAATYAQSQLQNSLRGVSVGQVMTPNFPVVPGEVPLDRLVAEHVMHSGDRSFIVAAGGHPRGMLTLTDVARVPQAAWPGVSAASVMVPWEQLKVVAPELALLGALKAMDDAQVNQLPVVAGDGRLVGLLSREQVLHYLRARMEVGV
jgi:Zn-dependent protease